MRLLADHLAFLAKVYGEALDASALADRDGRRWARWWEAEQRIRIRCANGDIRQGLVEMTRGPVPYFVLRKSAGHGSGGYRLTRADRIIALQTRGVYHPLERKS